jgi:hypothetical protein
MGAQFDPSTLDTLGAAREVRIVTGPASAPTAHRTIIWVVVDDRDRVLVRSVRGTRGRWYREAVANPDVALQLRGTEIPVRAVVANDPDRIEAASAGFRAKYRPGPSVDAMLAERTLETTLELVPR